MGFAEVVRQLLSSVSLVHYYTPGATLANVYVNIQLGIGLVDVRNFIVLSHIWLLRMTCLLVIVVGQYLVNLVSDSARSILAATL